MSLLPPTATRGRFVGKPAARFRSFSSEILAPEPGDQHTPAPQPLSARRSAVIDDLVKNGYLSHGLAAKLYSLAGLDGMHEGH